MNSSGPAKGVDSLIVTDMITLARNGAMSDAVLLSGDEDLRVGVQQAQEFGVPNARQLEPNCRLA